ncbi:hypothetical protein PN441_00210 [Spirulina major CS-329]|uniref:hypothetical protein n=1 Tax=Spirulina TaxID=1154 RepID=UPI00232F3E0B|nr:MULTISPECIES: hypothetical protein [Spirulina]MDB9495349.1 hypothetical protein [Spirulina subsalsa CS-330]MDB9501479.1 hypothetical protein [Spirulina major CS-329]
MASPQQIKQYLAYWVQLGKGIVIGDRPPMYCKTVLAKENYCNEFESIWQQVEACHGEGCHITGTDQELAELFSEQWNVTACYRCELLVPQKVRGMPATTCPCADIDTWPNLEIPKPRLPLSSNGHLAKISHRLTGLPHPVKSSQPLPCDPSLAESVGVDCALKLHLAKAKKATTAPGQPEFPQAHRSDRPPSDPVMPAAFPADQPATSDCDEAEVSC